MDTTPQEAPSYKPRSSVKLLSRARLENRFSNAQLREIISDYRNPGMTLVQIREKWLVSENAVTDLARKQGYFRRTSIHNNGKQMHRRIKARTGRMAVAAVKAKPKKKPSIRVDSAPSTSKDYYTILVLDSEAHLKVAREGSIWGVFDEVVKLLPLEPSNRAVLDAVVTAVRK